LLALALTGCAYTPPEPVRTDMRVILREMDHEDQAVAGTATYLPPINTCVVTLREYPQCLLHELRHCFEGQWHPGRTSDEDC
jgi:hypothetical protein